MTTSNTSSTPVEPNCPFCTIASATAPSTSPLTPDSFPPPPSASPTASPSAPFTPIAYTLLSTPHVLAFLDHAPIARGHTLVIVRAHREKLSDVRVEEGAMVGRWLGVMSRAVLGAVKAGEGEPGGAEGEVGNVGDWNVVQNNGARAAQVVPHVHFHIIPRVGDVPEVKAQSWTVFGRGQREDLDDEDAVTLVRAIRERVLEELERVRRREGEQVVNSMFGEAAADDWERRWSKL